MIPGEEEGRLAYLAVKSGLGLAEGSLVVFDTGGGSSQFTFGEGSRVDERFSVEVGAVRYTETFGLAGAVTPEVLRDALAAISADLSRIDGRPPPDALVGMGGAVTNITAVKHGLATYDPDVVQGTVLDRAEIDRQIELYRSRDAAARREIVGLQPKRADVILAGACIVRTVMEKLRPADADGERPRPPSRVARRTIRRLTSRRKASNSPLIGGRTRAVVASTSRSWPDVRRMRSSAQKCPMDTNAKSCLPVVTLEPTTSTRQAPATGLST